MDPRAASDRASAWGSNTRHPPAHGEDHKTRDNQLNTSKTSPESGGWRRRTSTRGETQGEMIATRTFLNSQNCTKPGEEKRTRKQLGRFFSLFFFFFVLLFLLPKLPLTSTRTPSQATRQSRLSCSLCYLRRRRRVRKSHMHHSHLPWKY